MHLLTDDQFEAFLSDGFVVLTPEIPEATHDHYYETAQQLYAKSALLGPERVPGTNHLQLLGDNLPGLVPRIAELFHDPVMAGALTSVLGADHVLHPHCFCHRSGRPDQAFHQDGNLPWNERGHYRSHRPDWAMIFYYPQAVTQELGPSEVVPGTQYWTRNSEKPDGSWYPGDPMDRSLDPRVLAGDNFSARDAAIAGSVDRIGVPNLKRRFVTVPKGSFLLAHYDIVHRGSRALPGNPERFMYKFYYARTREPQAPSWNNTRAAPEFSGARQEVVPVAEQIRAWCRGATPASCAGVQRCAADADEATRIAWAYRAGAAARHGDTGALDSLLDWLDEEDESLRRTAGYGLRQAGASAFEGLIDATRSARVGTRRYAAFALGNAATAASKEAALALMFVLDEDGDDLARSNAAYALGQLARTAGPAMDRIAATLLAHVLPGAEPANTRSGGMARSTVRESAAYGLLQAAVNNTLGKQHIETILNDVLFADEDRYVQGLLTEAMLRADLTASQLRRLSRGLADRRHFTEPPAIPAAAR